MHIRVYRVAHDLSPLSLEKIGYIADHTGSLQRYKSVAGSMHGLGVRNFPFLPIGIEQLIDLITKASSEGFINRYPRAQRDIRARIHILWFRRYDPDRFVHIQQTLPY